MAITGNMKVSVPEFRKTPNGLTVKLRGELDHHNAAYFRETVDKKIRETMPETLILDLSGIRFMDSSGLGFIMGRYALISKTGGRVIIRNPGRETEKICRLAGLERIIRIENDNKSKGEIKDAKGQ